jgi:hypothetical protein
MFSLNTLRNNKRATTVAAMLALSLVSLVAGCSDDDSQDSTVGVSSASSDIVIQDGNLTSKIVQNLNKNQPIPTYTYSLERANLINRQNLWNVPDKISYVTLVSYGKVFASFVVKGKVSSVNSLLTNPQQMVWNKGYSSAAAYMAMPSPDLDGSYGDNPPGSIFFFTTAGKYCEWHGDYFWSDQPTVILTPPEVTISADGQQHTKS